MSSAAPSPRSLVVLKVSVAIGTGKYPHAGGLGDVQWWLKLSSR